MFPVWILLVALSAAAWAVSMSLQRFILREKTTAIGFNVLHGILGSLFFIPFLFSAQFPSTFEPWKYFLLSIAVWTITAIFIRLQFKFVDVPFQLVLATTETFFAFSLGIIFLNEQLTLLKVIGLLAILCGVAIAGKGSGPKKFIATAIAVVCVASFLSASANVIDKYTIQFFDPFFFGFSIFFFSSLLTLPLIRGERLKQTKELIVKNKWAVVGSSFFTAVSYLALLFAYKTPSTEISVIYPLYGFFVLIAIPISIAITGEKQNLLYKIIGAVVATVGAILILGF